jgi:UDP-N-acetylglucosamine 2-epimerase (non-hydrolysing)
VRAPEVRKILIVVGTRPEAIKIAPLLGALQRSTPAVTVEVCITRQHSELLDPVLELFGIRPAFDLALMKPNQGLGELTARALLALDEVYGSFKPDLVLVQGDTTTAFAASLSAFYRQIPVAHVEAGLRTADLMAPWPEELNRRLTGVMASIHFAPTERARQNLLREGVAQQQIHVTGNTAVDAIMGIVQRLRTEDKLRAKLDRDFGFLDPERRLILVTGHRRESFGGGFERICAALARLSGRTDVEIVYPVHLNPNVRAPVFAILEGHKNVHLIEPVDYLAFAYLMMRSHIIISDSGGVQEEAPSLGKPVLVMRDVTERQEAVEAGVVRLVGTDVERIVSGAAGLLDDAADYASMSCGINPFGDGRAAERIARVLTA